MPLTSKSKPCTWAAAIKSCFVCQTINCTFWQISLFFLFSVFFSLFSSAFVGLTFPQTKLAIRTKVFLVSFFLYFLSSAFACLKSIPLELSLACSDVRPPKERKRERKKERNRKKKKERSKTVKMHFAQNRQRIKNFSPLFFEIRKKEKDIF